MADFAADDVEFIAKRLKAIQAERDAALARPADVVDGEFEDVASTQQPGVDVPVYSYTLYP